MSASNRLQQIDRQILDLLSERLEIGESESDEDERSDDESDEDADLEWWLEEGAERGIDDVTIEKFYRALKSLGQ